MRDNLMRRKLAAGEPVFGPSVPFLAPAMVEVAGLVGFDFIYLDAEHGYLDPGEVEQMVRAAEVRDITPVVRVPDSNPQTMLRYLDTGVAAVQVPHMYGPADVQRVLAASYYHPRGRRGLAGGRWADYGMTLPLAEATARVNAELLAIPQIEDREAIDALDEILAVPGLEMVFIGPADISQALGYPGRPDHPDVRKTLEILFARCREAGKWVGTAVFSPEQVAPLRQQGVQYFLLGGLRLFASGSREFLKAARAS